MRSSFSGGVSCVLLFLVAGCGDSDPSDPVVGPPATLEVAGSGQTGGAGAALATPLTVTVLDSEGRAVQGASVVWSTSDGSIVPATGTTDASGQAQATWTLAPRLGAQAATVTVAGELSQTFTATARVPSMTTLLQVSGDAQVDTIDATLDTLVVEVRLPSGAALPGVAIGWRVPAEGGTIVALDAVTDAAGRARAIWTVGGAPGPFDATVTGTAVASIVFHATVEPGAPTAIELAQDSLLLDKWGDTGQVGATITDRRGNLAPAGVHVWTSEDTTVARVRHGLVTSHRAGRVLVTLSTGGLSASLPVRVAVQRNSACIQPVPVPRLAPAGAPPYGPAQILTDLPDPEWPGARSLPVDYDGDGDDDVIRLEYSYPGHQPYSGETRVFRADGGTLVDVTATVLTTPVVPDHPRDFEIRDFDGDGAEEVYVGQHGFDADPFPGAPNLLLDLAGGAIVDVAPASMSPYAQTGFTHGSSSADVDCDGDLDIVELNLLPGVPNTLYLNNGAGAFTAAPVTAFPLGADDHDLQSWQEVVFVDIDGDADPDIFVGSRSGSGWNFHGFLVNDGFGNFRPFDRAVFPAPHFSPNRAINNAKAADFDGDGLEDLFLLEIPQPFSTASVARLWLNQGDGVFADASAAWGLPAQCTGELVEPLFVGDFNGDRWPDVTVPWGCAELGGAGLLINTGTGFTSFRSSSIEPWLEADPITPLDVDGDGDIDLFFGEHGGNPVLVENTM